MPEPPIINLLLTNEFFFVIMKVKLKWTIRVKLETKPDINLFYCSIKFNSKEYVFILQKTLKYKKININIIEHRLKIKI